MVEFAFCHDEYRYMRESSHQVMMDVVELHRAQVILDQEEGKYTPYIEFPVGGP